MFQQRRYQVVGVQPVLEHKPGEIFEADIPPVQEERLLACGALRIVPVPARKFPPALDLAPPNPEQKQQDDGAAAHTKRSE